MPDQRSIAIELMDQRRFSDAIPIFMRLIESTSDDWSLHYMLGQCYRFSNKIRESVRSLKVAASLNSSDPSIFLALGVSLQLAEEYESSIFALEHAIKLDGQFFTAYNSLGLTYRKIGNSEEALQWYSKAADGLVSAAMDEAREDRAKCYRDEVVDGKKTQGGIANVI